jgi:hypothetical protein
MTPRRRKRNKVGETKDGQGRKAMEGTMGETMGNRGKQGKPNDKTQRRTK